MTNAVDKAELNRRGLLRSGYAASLEPPDPLKAARADYAAGRISLDELERRLGEALAERQAD